MSDAHIRMLATKTDWKDALKRSNDTPVLIFKHSSVCPVSAKAKREITQFAEEQDVPVYQVVVQQNRSVSNDIETDLNVRHETPQALLLHDESSVFDASHFDVTADTLRTELDRLSSATN